MKLILARHLWGVQEPWETVFPRIRESGYHAVECGLPAPADRARFCRLLARHGLRFIAQISTRGADAAEHLESFRRQALDSRRLDPILVNAHSGCDGWPEQTAVGFFKRALDVESEAGVRVAHETHRGRILYAPWTTARILQQCPALMLCCDLSHWVCVSERLLQDQQEAIRKAAAHCLHVHARVGYEQGPQVPDPRAPEYAAHLAAHERWWRWIWAEQRRRGQSESTLTPEFGPPPYQHTLPYSGVPVSDLWEVCNWQAQRQAAQFAAWARRGAKPVKR